MKDLCRVTLVDARGYYVDENALIRTIAKPFDSANDPLEILVNLSEAVPSGRIVVAEAIEVTETMVLLSNGERIRYDYLVVATGSAYDLHRFHESDASRLFRSTDRTSKPIEIKGRRRSNSKSASSSSQIRKKDLVHDAISDVLADSTSPSDEGSSVAPFNTSDASLDSPKILTIEVHNGEKKGREEKSAELVDSSPSLDKIVTPETASKDSAVISETSKDLRSSTSKDGEKEKEKEKNKIKEEDKDKEKESPGVVARPRLSDPKLASVLSQQWAAIPKVPIDAFFPFPFFSFLFFFIFSFSFIFRAFLFLSIPLLSSPFSPFIFSLLIPFPFFASHFLISIAAQKTHDFCLEIVFV